MRELGKVISYNGTDGYIVNKEGLKITLLENNVIDKDIKTNDLVSYELEVYKDISFTEYIARFVKKEQM